jgi:hypothetical protein
MKKTQIGQITRLAWQIRKDAAKKFSCKVSQIIWKDCIKLATQKLESDKDITFNEWFNFYENNKKSFNYILFHNNIIEKNGKFTESQEMEAETTSAFYKILEAEEEDIKQLTLIKIMEYFDKHTTIKWKYRFSLYALMAFNAIKAHSRMIKRSRLSVNPDQQVKTGYNENKEKILLTEDPTGYNELRIDLKLILNSRQYEITQLLEAGYQKQEIAALLAISRQSIHKNLLVIRQKISNYYQQIV